MSRYISNLAVAEFDRDVKRAYAASANLRPLVKVKTGVIGSTCRFQKSNQGLATQKENQVDVTPMSVEYSHVTATLGDWVAPEYTDIFNAPKVNFDERAELVAISASAIARREDQIIIDALAAGATTLTIPKDFDTFHGMSTAKFRQAKRLFDQYNVPGSERVFLTSAEGLYDMLGDDEANNFDTNAVKALVSGEITKWLGFEVRSIGFMEEGGIPLAANEYTSFAFHKSSVGMAVGLDMRTEINYIAQKTSWLVNTVFSAGAVAIDSYGMIGIKHAAA